LVDMEIKLLIFLISLVTGVVTLGAFFWFWNIYGEDISAARTVAFAMLGIDSLVYVFSARSLRKPVLRTSFLSNPWLIAAVAGGFLFQIIALYTPFMQKVLETHPLHVLEWAAVILEAVLVIVIIEGVKWWFLKKRKLQSKWAKIIG
jgi:magnesium-transporting ATPase (P-type)